MECPSFTSRNLQYRELNVFAFWRLKVRVFDYVEFNDHISFKQEYVLKRTLEATYMQTWMVTKSPLEQLLKSEFKEDQEIMLINH